ncbi:hypothetical protein RJ639_031692 [Escallonia herrerae]|uniref:Growth-regulating factor n=1 Tax=Escallonia herrerae TaxID=1293975 RepID=A0AA88WXI0_9ASTE|nr:hypothetical protein RJ639_031692 [Escallonia herrerae]
MAIKSENTLDGSKSFLLPVSANFQLTTPLSLGSDNDPATITSFADGNSINYHHVYANNDSCATPTTFYTCNRSKESDGNANGIFTTATATTAATFNHARTKISFSRNNSDYNRNNGNFVAPGFGFFPRSVLEGGSGFEPCIETEPRRCSLTDGKNWRCKREVIPEKKYCPLHIHRAGYTGSRSDLGSCIESERQRCGRTDGIVIPERKYCDQHMHKGAKKPFVASETVTVAAAPPALTKPKNFDTRLNLNTGLSMSIPARPPVISSEEHVSVSSSSSDDTTIKIKHEATINKHQFCKLQHVDVVQTPRVTFCQYSLFGRWKYKPFVQRANRHGSRASAFLRLTKLVGNPENALAHSSIPNSTTETETDHIGLMLMASAGYDPPEAPRAFEKLWPCSIHPFDHKIAELLKQSNGNGRSTGRIQGSETART